MSYDFQWWPYKPYPPDMPADFHTVPYAGIDGFFKALRSVHHTSVVHCSDGGEHPGYCDACETRMRPVDFGAFRIELKKLDCNARAFCEMADYMEEHPDVWVGESY